MKDLHLHKRISRPLSDMQKRTNEINKTLHDLNVGDTIDIGREDVIVKKVQDGNSTTYTISPIPPHPQK